VIRDEAWKPADGLTLEPNALRAAKERENCLALTAGPGAGKSEMLAQRADFLLRTGNCRYPKRILAISFKVDASRNLEERVHRRCGAELASRFDSFTFHAFAKRIIDRFRPVLQGKDALVAGYKIGDSRISHDQIGFIDLVPLAIQILQRSEVAKRAIRQTYSDVFLDEFQDCTVDQYQLIKIAFEDTAIRLTAVGDTKQRIMGWAGALDGIFTAFAQDFEALPLNLYRNFRSLPKLLRMQNEVIRNLDPSSVMPEDQIQGDGGQVFAWKYPNALDEANGLARLVADWVRNEGVPLAEIAILLPRQLELFGADLMAGLGALGIPYRNEQQLQDASSEPAAKLIVDYLSCLYGQREPKAWVRLMQQLIPFDDDDMQRVNRRDFQRFIETQRKEVALDELVNDRYSTWRKSVVDFLKKVGTETLMALSPDYEAHARLTEVVKATFVHIDDLLKQEPDLLKVLQQFSEDQSVRILTVHKSKGLEFDSVIMPAVENQTWWGDANEQLCVFFVGISRAKRRLVLTYAEQRERPAGHSRQWSTNRTPQEAYFAYAAPFV
jgi:superfamily I DNA/RNA helicase